MYQYLINFLFIFYFIFLSCTDEQDFLSYTDEQNKFSTTFSDSLEERQAYDTYHFPIKIVYPCEKYKLLYQDDMIKSISHIMTFFEQYKIQFHIEDVIIDRNYKIKQNDIGNIEDRRNLYSKYPYTFPIFIVDFIKDVSNNDEYAGYAITSEVCKKFVLIKKESVSNKELLLHEFGHLLSLKHTDNDKQNTMHPYPEVSFFNEEQEKQIKKYIDYYYNKCVMSSNNHLY